MSPFDDPAVLERFAELAVGFAANVQEGQIVSVKAELGKEPIVRALAAAAYRHGATYVDVEYIDLHVRKARLAHATDAALETLPPHLGRRITTLGDLKAARIGLTGPSDPRLMEGVDQVRAGRDRTSSLKEQGEVVNARTTNWTALPGPTRAWAQYVHPDLEPDAAWQKLGEQLVHVCRLDEDDPVAAWTQRAEVLLGAADRLTTRRFDALRFRGEGTDLTVGLLPTSSFIAAHFHTLDGIRHMPNLPSEEIFTTPDPLRVDGVVRATKPLVLGGAVIEGLEVEFRDGIAVRIDADKGADVLRGHAAKDPGAARLGEVALVDGDGRIGKLDTVFFDTLLDENAASHIALGSAYAMVVGEEDIPNINQSAIHVDFMIGSTEMEVDGLTAAGEAVPVLRGGAWQL